MWKCFGSGIGELKGAHKKGIEKWSVSFFIIFLYGLSFNTYFTILAPIYVLLYGLHSKPWSLYRFDETCVENDLD